MTSIVVGKDRISLIESERYVSGTKNVYLLKVSFSEDWEGLEKKLVFHTDSFDISVDVLSCSEQLPIPSQIFARPTSKLQIGAYGSKCGTTMLNTRWLSLGRVVKGTFTPQNDCNCGCEQDSMPSPETYKFLRQLIDRKADRLTYENGMFVLWAGNDPLSSFDAPAGLPIGGEKGQILAKASDSDGDYRWITYEGGMSLRVPLGTIVAWSGDLDFIPDGYSLCDGQNGTVDLRNAFIMGASQRIKPGTIIDPGPHARIDPFHPEHHDHNDHHHHHTPDGPLGPDQYPHGHHKPNKGPDLNRYRYYALAFIQKTSLTEQDEKEGKTAYDIAVENGFDGTEAEWLESLKGEPGPAGKDGLPGKDGKSAYDIAVENGFDGSEEEWIEKIETSSAISVVTGGIIDSKDTAPQGSGDYYFKDVTLRVHDARVRALSVYFVGNMVSVDLSDPAQITFTLLDNMKYIAKLDESDYIVEITDVLTGSEGGEVIQGPRGEKGEDGKTAYQIAVENGFVGDEKAWLESLKGATGDIGPAGENGKSAYQIAVENNFEGDEQKWLESLKGKDGTDGEPGKDGKSAYEIAKDHDFDGDEEQWLESLKGKDGETGPAGEDGKSAYQIAVDKGFRGDEQEWLESLRGEEGRPGLPGQNGSDGKSAYQIAVDNGFHGSEEDWLASLQGEPGEDGKSIQKIDDYSSEEDTIVGRWIDKKPIKRRVFKLSDISVTSAGVKALDAIEGNFEHLTMVRLQVIADFKTGDDKGILMGPFSSQLPAMCDDVWFSVRYYPDEDTSNFYLYANGLIDTPIKMDLTIIFDYVNPGDAELSDDDLYIDNEGSGSTTPGEGTSDHRELTHRDSEQQHPISAITDLTARLATRPNQAIENSEIDTLFK